MKYDATFFEVGDSQLVHQYLDVFTLLKKENLKVLQIDSSSQKLVYYFAKSKVFCCMKITNFKLCNIYNGTFLRASGFAALPRTP